MMNEKKTLPDKNPTLEKAANECINIIKRKFPNCRVDRNKTNDNSISITFSGFESEDDNSEYDENGKLKNRRERRKMAYVYHTNSIQASLQNRITNKYNVLCRILLTRDESGKFIKSLTIHMKQRKLFQRNAFSRFDKKKHENFDVIKNLMEELEIFEEKYDIK